MGKLHTSVRFVVLTLIFSLCIGTMNISYAGTCEAVHALPFLWNNHTLYVSYALDNGTIKSNNAAAGKKSVQVFLESLDDTLSWDEVTSCGSYFALRALDGTEYSMVSCGFQAVEGSSRNIADLVKSQYVGFSPIFDVPADIVIGDLMLTIRNGETGEVAGISLAGVPSEEPLPVKILPEELIGTWHGTGTPVGGGSAISLSITINADGTGKYTFEQAGYIEYYPFTLESDSNQFSVIIPANNQLSIATCEGMYDYSGGVLTLRITTTFSSGRQFEYVADCTKDVDLSEN